MQFGQGLKPSLDRNIKTVTDEEIRKYFFTVYEAQQMLGTISTRPIINRLKSGEVTGIKQGRSWMVRPDQIEVLRNLIPSCRRK